jgi:hypothetical protein
MVFMMASSSSWFGESPDYVNAQNMKLHFEGAPNVRVLIQMQTRGLFEVDLLFCNVQQSRIVTKADNGPQCRFENGRLSAKFLQIEEILADSLSYRIRAL